MLLEELDVRIRGIVQGVGFRPMVYRVAKSFQLKGEVINDAEGVLIRLSVNRQILQDFLQRMRNELPPLAEIKSIEITQAIEEKYYEDFYICESESQHGVTEITADAATCIACLDEVSDPNQRRHLYPFTNCTHCGPRLSIVEGIPYDRVNTTMVPFEMCNNCFIEYTSPIDRRFHAQPIGCHHCGPQLHIFQNKKVIEDYPGDSVARTKYQFNLIHQALKDGKVIAIKGIGGFHLCCDGTNEEAVALLRYRKHRYAKPFALMCHDIPTIERYCEVSVEERNTLKGPSAPIVLLQECKTDNAHPELAKSIAPGSNLLGFMLPYTPLHTLICQKFELPLVMTSGNLSGEPQIIGNQEAIEKLANIVDLIIFHDREIANRIDDSVVRFISGKMRMMRRARGYAPKSIHLPVGFESSDQVLAYGAELKSTFCLVKQGMAFISQHQGDLENLSTFDDYEKNLQLYKQLFQFDTKYIAHDKHPEYLSTKLAIEHALENDVDRYEIQHHHAHVASAMAENNISLEHGQILGIALDGLGLGADNTFWGGEFLLADYTQAQRIASFTSIAMPGGTQAIKQPWRNTYAHIVNCMSWEEFAQQYAELELTGFLHTMPHNTLHTMLQRDVNSPKASSVGRLFDAVAGALGLSPERVQFEGQAAIELEMLVDTNQVFQLSKEQAYQFTLNKTDSQSNNFIEINTPGLWPQLLGDLASKQSHQQIATKFHAGLIYAITDCVLTLLETYKFTDVALSGGCFQNGILLQGVERVLKEQGLNCLSHSLVPANDGGISLGQAAIAAARIIKNYK